MTASRRIYDQTSTLNRLGSMQDHGKIISYNPLEMLQSCVYCNLTRKSA